MGRRQRIFRRRRNGKPYGPYYAWFYEDGIRVQRSTKVLDREAAEKIADQWERDAADPDHAAAHKATLSHALQMLLRDREEQARSGRRSIATVGFYKCKVGHLTRIFEYDQGVRVPFPLASLRPRDVDEYISQRRREGASENTVSKELIALRAALKLARRAGLWHGEPSAVCPVAFAPEYKPRDRFLTSAELQILLGELLPDRSACIAFIVATSANWRETRLVRPGDVAADLSTVLLRGTKTRTRFRMVPIVSEEQRTLLRYALDHAAGTGGLLFAPWVAAGRDIARACKRAGMAHCTPNDLRRTCSTWLRQAGAPPHLIAPIMGHVDTRMVERVYGRLPLDDRVLSLEGG